MTSPVDSATPGVGIAPGSPHPLGVTPVADGVNAAVWAPEATRIELCVFAEDDSETRFELPGFTDGVWHGRVPGIAPGTRYGFRATGPRSASPAHRFNPAKLLIDPYTQLLEGPVRWHPWQSGHDPHDSAAVVPKCVVPRPARAGDTPRSDPDPATNRPGHPRADLVIYEVHVKGATAAHPEVPPELRGSYAGMAHPAFIAHLVSLGVNAVELLPVQAFVDDRHVVERGLTNYWGYQPIAHLAPEPRYASGAEAASAERELRQLVHALHEAGIEVLLDVVFNHTGEGDDAGPTLSLRGLHNAGYYRLRDAGRDYIDDTGTGNTLAVGRPMVLRLVMDSLRHWAEHYGVDGFRFDLASTLGRTEHGFDPAAAFFQAVAQDPVLAPLKLIAEPWDLGPGGYHLGRFPTGWAEWNDRFRDGVRRAWKGEALGHVDLGAALLGSATHFDHSGQDASSSLNFLTAHDGFTLADLVSYSQKQNTANGEHNRDGHDENHSDHLGVEGETTDPAVQAARRRRRGAMLATLLVSQGTPMLLAGDEIGNSQGGNNNAYAQDNPIGWIDWNDPDTEILALVRRLIALRSATPLLRQRRFLHGHLRADGRRDIRWTLADSSEPTASDWDDPECRCIVAEIRGAADDPAHLGGSADGEAVLIVLNFGGDRAVQLPPPAAGHGWRIAIDTARPEAAGDPGGVYAALAQSVIVCTSAQVVA